jgi:hypothetical protein
MRFTTCLIFILVSLSLVNLQAGEKANFSGEWTLSEEKSTLDEMGTQFLPSKLVLTQTDSTISIERAYQGPDGDFNDSEKLTLDGKECKSEVFGGSPRTSAATWSAAKDTLNIKTLLIFNMNGDEAKINTIEKWNLGPEGKTLLVKYNSSSQWGDRNDNLVFVKKGS